MKKNRLTLLRLLHISSCLVVPFFSSNGFAQTVDSDYNTGTDFSKFKTYAWLAPGDSVLNRPAAEKLFGGYVEKAANEELKKRGLKLVKEQPDAIFIFFTNVEEITKYSQSATLSVGVSVAGPGYYVGGSAPVAGGKITASTVEDGTLGFSMYDVQNGKLVWNASVKKSFKMSDDIAKIIEDYTQKIFKKMPRKKAKN